MINIQDLQFFYEDKQVLFDIGLNLPRHTITGLIGPNGAGKSTLMRCIAGLEIPQHGQLLLDGKPILDNPRESYVKIGYLPDIFGLSENLTVLQCWTYAASARGIKQDQLAEAIERTANVLNLTDQLNHKVSQLSRGQKQRTGIGQVIIHNPQFLILDEPASGLDPDARYELSKLFNSLKDSGMTLLVSSHILSELDEYCTHMLIIQEGRILQHRAIQSAEDTTGHLQNSDSTMPLVLKFDHLSEQQIEVIRQAPHILHLQMPEQPRLQLVTVTIGIDPQKRIELIRYLVEQQLSLIGVEPLKESLLQSYRNSLSEQAPNFTDYPLPIQNTLTKSSLTHGGDHSHE